MRVLNLTEVSTLQFYFPLFSVLTTPATQNSAMQYVKTRNSAPQLMLVGGKYIILYSIWLRAQNYIDHHSGQTARLIFTKLSIVVWYILGYAKNYFFFL